MKWFEILFLSIYALLLIAYIITKARKVDKRRRGVIKISMSAMFVVIGVYGGFVNDWSNSLAFVCLAGLIFAGIGDYFLIFSDVKAQFHRGVVSFGISNILLIIASICTFGISWFVLLPYVICMATNIILQKVKVYTFGSSIVYLNCYTTIVAFNGCLGLMILLCNNLTIMGLLFGLGTLMFMLSDIFLGMYCFKLKNWVIDGINSLLYFGGLALIALSMVV